MNVVKKFRDNPWLLAGSIVLLVVAWMLTGVGSEPQAQQAASADDDAKRPEVRAQHQQAETIERFITVYGRSEPARTVTLKAETVGKVTAIHADRGSYLDTGDDIIEIDLRDRREQLSRAKADVEQARIRYEAEQRLKGDSLSSEVRLAEAKAALEGARAELKRIQIDLDKTTVEAPFAGSLQERMVEVGDYVKVGDPVAEFVDIDTLIITGSVSETERKNLEIGEQASATLITGQEVHGTVRYIAPVADEATRTFLVEIEVDNSDRALPAGVTAEISLPAGKALAHRISPAILTLDKNGEIGIKTIEDDGTVSFTRVDIMKSTGEGIWVGGLPKRANIITVGQGFVKPGENVTAVYEEGPKVKLAGEDSSAAPIDSTGDDR